jgi:hypothetical protein
MLSKPLAAGLVIGGILIAAFAGGYIASKNKGGSDAPPEIPGFEDLKPEPAAQPPAGAGAGAATGTPPAPAGGTGAAAPAGGGAPAAPGGGGGPKVPRLRDMPLPQTAAGGGTAAPAGGAPGAGTPGGVAPGGNPAAAGNPGGAGTLEELVVPAGTIMGLVLTKPVSTESAKVEDPVEARVTQDINSGAQLAVPAGTKVVGSVTVVDKGGKIKEPAKIGIKFHTLALNTGAEVPVAIDPLTYQADPGPAQRSTRNIAIGAAGGAALGWLLGGKKGAIQGGTVGAGAGTAVTQVTNSSVATLPAGAQARVVITAPFTVVVKK